MPLSARHPQRRHNRKITLPAPHAGAETEAEMPIDSLPAAGIGTEAAYELISSELLLDGQSRLNLATFVTTWMPSAGGRLMAETADKNIVDKDEYPQTAEIEARCVNILAELWGSPEAESATGCSTTGSSEAAMLAGMALKWRWRARQEASGKPADRPNLEWDFRIPRVQSINASGHKYGLVYPGVGWAIWRDKQALPRDLVFDVNYLGGHMPTFSLNFSRPGSEVIAQYFMFTSLGHNGYTAKMSTLRDTAMHISDGVSKLGPYRLISDGSELPVFAFALRPDTKNYTVFDVSERLRERGWLVPAYTFPENRQDLSVLRVVVRSGMHMEMADELLHHLRRATEMLEELGGPLPRPLASTTQAFAH